MDEQNSQEQKKPGLLDLLLARKTATDASAQPQGPDKASIDTFMQVLNDANKKQPVDPTPSLLHPFDRLRFMLGFGASGAPATPQNPRIITPDDPAYNQ